MKQFHKISVMMMICFFIAHSAFADVTVDGFCYLEGETDHSGTKVLFNAASPSAVTDSVYTNADGSYLIDISEGVYTVHFSHDGWQAYTIPGEIIIYEDTTLEDVELSSDLIEEVSGPQSGVWTSDILYHVIGDISVSQGETLTIEPGVIIKFMDYYSFNINGTLLASGTETDSIIFTSGQASCNQDDWDRIKFEDSSNDNSIISCATIKYAFYGIYCYQSSPIISNNFISNNTSGIKCLSSSSPTISNNTINNNSYGIECQSSSPTISNNIINNNYDGISCYNNSTPIISNNTISNYHFGIICNLSSSPTISHNTINNCDRGIHSVNSSSPIVSNNTIGNNNFGISFSNCYIINNILYENNVGIEVYSNPSSLDYNLFWGNNTTASGSGLPTAFGVIVTVNANGDPCDPYYNLFMDPLFMDPGNLNFHLTENSPCIDAGNPDPVYYDPDGTISDIGALYFEQSQVSQQINLSSGFSFVSSHIIPDNLDMLIVMASVLNENLDFVRNSQGQTLRKIGPNWVNGIGDWVVTEGYLVKMFTDDSFIIEGNTVDPTTPISVATGFQFVSYFPENPMDALFAFETIIGDDLDFIRNSQGQTIRKIGPNWVNGIGDCQSGEGYLVKMFADGELIYPSVGGGVTSIDEDFQSQVNYEDINIPGWLNINEIGSRKWQGKEYENNVYAQATSYNSGEINIYWLITPKIALFEMNSPIFSFESAQAFWTHDCFSIIISTDFDGSDLSAATWTPLDCVTANQNHPDHEWIPSGEIDLSSYSGFANIAFRYEGNDNIGENTSYRIDNVLLIDENEAAVIVTSIEKAEKHWKNIVGDPSKPVWTIYFENGELEKGDEIAVYYGEKLAGSGVVVSDNILENAIPVFSNLYKVGNKPIIKVWDNSENKEYVLKDYTFSNPYGDAWIEDVFPEEDGEYSLMNFSTTGISDENMINNISIYPNPSNGIFNISLVGIEGDIQIKVLDLRGKEYSNFESIVSASTQLDLSDLPAGVYFISFSGKDFSQVKKIVIQ
jgi:parallel beta-helix repeat protein